MRRYFVEVLAWTHGVQFVCLAFQNAMAALIDGFTIHHWTGIPVGDAQGTESTRDSNKFSSKCLCLRFLVCVCVTVCLSVCVWVRVRISVCGGVCDCASVLLYCML